MKWRIFLIGFIVLLLTFSSLPLLASPEDEIVVVAADSLETNSLSTSATLIGFLNQVANRIALQYGDSAKYIGLVAVPATLNNHLNAVAARIGLGYGDGDRHLPLIVIPTALQTRLNGVADHVTFQYPDSNRQFGLTYPSAVIEDSTPPVIIVPPQANASGEVAYVSWTTNEFTSYVLRYGTAPGNYPDQISSSVFEKQHLATLTGLTAETYYYRIISTDLNGNNSTSSEYTFSVQHILFLPVVLR